MTLENATAHEQSQPEVPMSEELYILTCPTCGDVETVIPGGEEDLYDMPIGDEEIDQIETPDTSGRPVGKVRCPHCGRWLDSSAAKPE